MIHPDKQYLGALPTRLEQPRRVIECTRRIHFAAGHRPALLRKAPFDQSSDGAGVRNILHHDEDTVKTESPPNVAEQIDSLAGERDGLAGDPE